MSLLNVGRWDAGAQVTWRPLQSVSIKWSLPVGHLRGMRSVFQVPWYWVFFLKASDSGVMRSNINSSVLMNKGPHNVAAEKKLEMGRSQGLKKKNPAGKYGDPQIHYSLGVP